MIPCGQFWFGGGSWHSSGLGRKSLLFSTKAELQTSLDELGALIDRSNADRVLASLYKTEKARRPGLLAMFKALLLATWYDLSGVARSKALSDRIASLIDATIIGSAAKGDHAATWVRPRTRAPAHGYKAHIAADKDTGIIRDVATAPANQPDVSIAPAIPDAPSEVYADRAYDARSVEKTIEAAGGTSKLMRKGHRHLPAERMEAHNRPLRRIRARIEKIFGTWKRSYRFRCMRWLGLSKAPGPSRGYLLKRQTLLASENRLSGSAKRIGKTVPPATSRVPSRRFAGPF